MAGNGGQRSGTGCVAWIAFGILCGVAVLLGAGAILRGCWLAGAFLPPWIRWETRYISADLDGDAGFETVVLDGRRLSVMDDGDEVPATTPVADALEAALPDDWLTSDVLVTDVDHDGREEVVTLTWKRGSFGSSRPFWIEEDDRDFSEHLCIFAFEDGGLRHRWLSSAIDEPIAAISKDERQRLHVLDPGGGERICEWQSFGLAYVDDANPSRYEADRSVLSVAAVGDVIPHGGVQASDLGEALSPVADLIADADVAIANLEAPLVEDVGNASGTFPRFAASTAFGDALVAAGFDVFALANNHIADAGEAGIRSTLESLRSHEGVAATGISEATGAEEAHGDVALIERDGVEMAVIDGTFGLNAGADSGRYAVAGIDEAGLVERLRWAAERVDVSVCYLHAGEEYASSPAGELEALVGRLADAGADVILCSHPHVVQRSEHLATASGREAYVCYSLGNFIANQPFPETVLGAVATFAVEKPLAPDAADGTASASGVRIRDFQVVPTVCHFGAGETTVLPLAAYTDDLAETHHLNAIEPDSVGLDILERQFLSLQ